MRAVADVHASHGSEAANRVSICVGAMMGAAVLATVDGQSRATFLEAAGVAWDLTRKKLIGKPETWS